MKRAAPTALASFVFASFVCASSVFTSVGCIPAELRTFDIPADTSVEVPGSQTGANNPLTPDAVFPPGALGDAISQAMAQSFSTEGVNAAAVESAKVTEMRLVANDAEQSGRQVRGLGFLSRAAFTVSAEGFDPVSVASSAPNAFDGEPGPAEVVLTLTDAELAPIAQSGNAVEMQGDVEPEGQPVFSTTVSFFVKLTVVVDPFKALGGS